MPISDTLKSVRIVTAAELEVNGGRFKLRQGPAIKVRGYTTSNIGSRMVKGGDAQPVYVLSDTDIESGGGRWKVNAGQAIQVTDVIGDARGVIQGAAIPVFPVDDDGVYDPSFSGYFNKILVLEPIGYWPMWESAGLVSEDLSGNSFDGAYNANVVLGGTGIGDGNTSAQYPGNGFDNVFSAGLQAAFNGSVGTIIFWLRILNAAVWTDGTSDTFANFDRGVGTNYVRVFKSTVNNRVDLEYRAGAVSKVISDLTATELDFICYAMTWDAPSDLMVAYKNGASLGSLNGLGIWGGLIHAARSIWGANTTGLGDPTRGWIAHAALFDIALTPTQILNISEL